MNDRAKGARHSIENRQLASGVERGALPLEMPLVAVA